MACEASVYDLRVTTPAGVRVTRGPFPSHADASAAGRKLLNDGSAVRVDIFCRTGALGVLISRLGVGQRPGPDGREPDAG